LYACRKSLPVATTDYHWGSRDNIIHNHQTDVGAAKAAGAREEEKEEKKLKLKLEKIKERTRKAHESYPGGRGMKVRSQSYSLLVSCW
jgi:hypothetical protein